MAELTKSSRCPGNMQKPSELLFNIVNTSRLRLRLKLTPWSTAVLWHSSRWRYLCFSPAVFQFRIPINLCKARRQSQGAVSTTAGMKRIMLLGWCSLQWWRRRRWWESSLAGDREVCSSHLSSSPWPLRGRESRDRLLPGVGWGVGLACNMCISGLWWAEEKCWCARWR